MSLSWSKRPPSRTSLMPHTARMLACGFLLHGCQSGMGNPDLGGPGMLRPQDGRSGQTGSPESGPRECTQDGECQETGEARAESLRTPSALRRSFAGAKCEQVGLIGGTESENRSGPTCVCDLGDGGSLQVGPAGGDCQVRGRAGTCLWESFDGCDRFDTHSCDAVCTDLEQRLAADAEHSFDAQLLYFDCEKNSCRSVLSIDGQCTPGAAVGTGKSYDCAQGGPAILDAYEGERAAGSQPDASRESWPRPERYVDGTRGVIEVGVNSEVWAGSETTPPVTFAMAQFCDTRGSSSYSGEVLDPLEGNDDCGVVRKGMWQSSDQSFFSIGDASLDLNGQSYAFELAPGNVMYQPEQRFNMLAPPYGASARFHAKGGALTGALDIPVRVPAALQIESLADSVRVERTALRLRWTGKGSAPLHVLVQVTPQLADVLYFTELECLLKDDGEFEIPTEVMAKLPQGIATATFRREVRSVESSAGQKLLSIGSVQETVHLAVGERCERQGVLDACKKFAAHQQAVFQQCGSVPAPALEATCPAYLAESCVGCVDYYECGIKALRCENGSPTYYSGCSCPVL